MSETGRPSRDPSPRARPAWLTEAVSRLVRHPFSGVLLKYVVAGGICALTDLAIFSLLFYTTGFDIIVCATPSFIVATGLNYVLSARYVFGSGRRPPSHVIVMVYVASALGYAANIGALWIAYHQIGLNPELSKIVGIGAAFFWNFGIRFFVIFR